MLDDRTPAEADLDARIAVVTEALARARRSGPPFPGAFELETMLADEEVALLYQLARDVVTGGVVVELGTFLGGSTVALGRGLVDGGVDARIETYDVFRQPAWPAYGIADGEDVLPRWERNVSAVRHLVDVHAGRLEDLPAMPEAPGVDLLFVDIVKDAPTVGALMSGFVSRLRPGSVLVHQDLFHWGSPWVAVTVEALWDHLRYVGQVARSSGVFVVRDSLAEAARALDWERISTTVGLIMIDRLAARFEHPTLRGTLELSALYLARTADEGLFERRRAALEPRMTGPRLTRFYQEVVEAAPEGALRPGGRRQ